MKAPICRYRERLGPLHVLVMAKAPVPGLVKTRLCPPCTPNEAAMIAESCLADTLAAVAGCHAERKVVALDGPPGPWLPAGFDVLAQRGSSFDQRLENAWADLGTDTVGGVQIGMDTPQITPELLDRQLSALMKGRALLGPATDGGWWLIGLRGTVPRRMFSGVPMSCTFTGAAQTRRLRSLGLDVLVGPQLTDIDTVEDLCEVTPRIPASRTAATARALLPGLYTVPLDTVPLDTVPLDTVPLDTVPLDTVPLDTVPLDTVPLAEMSA